MKTIKIHLHENANGIQYRVKKKLLCFWITIERWRRLSRRDSFDRLYNEDIEARKNYCKRYGYKLIIKDPR